MTAQPPVERQEHDEGHEEECGADGDDATGVDLHRRRLHEFALVCHGTEPTGPAMVTGAREAMRVDLGPGPPPEQVALLLAGEPGLVCLHGAWAAGTALVTWRPEVVVPGDADAPTALAVQPAVAGAAAERGDFVGGGWFGWSGYDGTHRWGWYEHVLRYAGGHWWFEGLAAPDGVERLAARQLEAVTAIAGAGAQPTHRLGSPAGADRATHLATVERAIADIRAGQIYQVNVCTRLSGTFAGDPASLYATAATALRPDFGAYLSGLAAGQQAVVCLSPELFLRRRGPVVLTGPIKGTWPRRDGAAGAIALRASAKDTAENVMIVDLMRNDLGRVSRVGGVSVPALLEVQPHPGVWHLVSTVRGELRDDIDDGALLRATFPPGSVTGAPKHRAVELIADYEPASRGAYTGAAGYLSPVAGIELTVLIRTFEVYPDRYELGVGGGITADSVPVREWRECLDKAAPLLVAAGAGPGGGDADEVPTAVQRDGGLLETILVRDGRPIRLAEHLARLDRSCRELYGGGIARDAAVAAEAALAPVPASRAVLRLVVSPAREVSATVAPAATPPERCVAVSHPARPGSWRHKWAARGELEAAERAAQEHGPDAVPLFLAEDGTFAETSRGTLFVLAPDGTLCTPALGDHVLPGTTRLALLDLARDEGRAIRIGPVAPIDLRAGVTFWTSSLSGAVLIEAVDGVACGADPRSLAAVAHFATHLSGALPIAVAP